MTDYRFSEDDVRDIHEAADRATPDGICDRDTVRLLKALAAKFPLPPEPPKPVRYRLCASVTISHDDAGNPILRAAEYEMRVGRKVFAHLFEPIPDEPQNTEGMWVIRNRFAPEFFESLAKEKDDYVPTHKDGDTWDENAYESKERAQQVIDGLIRSEVPRVGMSFYVDGPYVKGASEKPAKIPGVFGRGDWVTRGGFPIDDWCGLVLGVLPHSRYEVNWNGSAIAEIEICGGPELEHAEPPR